MSDEEQIGWCWGFVSKGAKREYDKLISEQKAHKLNNLFISAWLHANTFTGSFIL